jgi:hypothetical protein
VRRVWTSCRRCDRSSGDDLTGDAKTALKGSVNKYNRAYSTDFADRYDPLALQSDTRNWSDCDYLSGTSTWSSLVLPTNRDGIAQDNEIGLRSTLGQPQAVLQGRLLRLSSQIKF